MQPDAGSPVALPRSHVGPRRVDDGVVIACGLALGASSIHVAAAVDHLSHYWPHGVFFGVLAAGQLALSVGLYRSTRSYPLALAIATSVPVVMLWVLSRTSGLPIAPEPWSPEPVGPLDAVASADELLLALLAALQLRGLSSEATMVAPKRIAMVLGLVLITLSALVLSGAKHTH